MDGYKKPITWISTGEAAKLLHVSSQTVRDWTAQGRLSAEHTAGGHRQYDDYEIRRVALEARGINEYWGDDVIIQLAGDGTVHVLGENLDPYTHSVPYSIPLRPRHGSDRHQRSDLIRTGEPQVIGGDMIDVAEAGPLGLVAQTYLAVSAFDRAEVARLLELHIPKAVAWLRREATPVAGVARWESPTGKRYHSAY